MTTSRLTALGKLFNEKSINKASIARRTDITKQRLTTLSRDRTTKILASEVYLIAVAIDMDPGKLLDTLCGHLKGKVKKDPLPGRRKTKKREATKAGKKKQK